MDAGPDRAKTNGRQADDAHGQSDDHCRLPTKKQPDERQ
jgi:hypothetical protein